MPSLSRRSFLAAAASLPVVSALPSIGCAEPECLPAGWNHAAVHKFSDRELQRRWDIIAAIFADAAIASLQAELAKTDRSTSILPRSDG